MAWLITPMANREEFFFVVSLTQNYDNLFFCIKFLLSSSSQKAMLLGAGSPLLVLCPLIVMLVAPLATVAQNTEEDAKVIFISNLASFEE